MPEYLHYYEPEYNPSTCLQTIRLSSDWDDFYVCKNYFDEIGLDLKGHVYALWSWIYDGKRPVFLSDVSSVSHTLSIDYHYEDGTEAAPSYVQLLEEGSAYDVLSPEIPGYTPDKASIAGEMGEEDAVFTVTYIKDPIPVDSRTLTIYYLLADGSQTAEPYSAEMAVGADVREGADDHSVLDDRFAELGGIDAYTVAHLAVPDRGIGAQKCVFSDGGTALKDHAGEQDRPLPYRGGGTYVGVVGVYDPYAPGQEPFCAQTSGQRLHRGAAVSQVLFQGEDPALPGLGIAQGGKSFLQTPAILEGGGQSGASESEYRLGGFLAGEGKRSAFSGQKNRAGHHGKGTGDQR